MQRAPAKAPAVVVDGVGKSFHLPHERSHTLKERALHPFRRSGQDRLDALRDVSFAVEQGEFFGIVGRNGSGKSTLLKCMAGIYGTDHGAIYVNGRMSTFIELGVGFNPDLAARDNVVLNSIMLGVSPKEARARFDEVIAFAELEEFIDLKLKNYSSGMMVRLAFATAIQADADVLLIDEVLAVGDAAFQQKCFDVFKGLREAGKTILFVTHDMGTVMRFCDRAMLLDRGRIVAVDAPSRIAEEYLRLNFEKERSGPGEAGAIDTATAAVEILEAWTEDEHAVRRSSFMVHEYSILKAELRFNEELVDPDFNMVWVNERGDNVFAVSTASYQSGTGRFSAGETVVIAIAFRASLAPGRYEINFNVSAAGAGHQMLLRGTGICSIVVASPAAGGGLVDFPHELVIHRAGDRAERIEATTS